MYLKLLQKEQFKRLQTSANGYDKEIPRERYISLEERQKIINTRNQPPKFSTRNQVEINNESREHIISVTKLNLKLQ